MSDLPWQLEETTARISTAHGVAAHRVAAHLNLVQADCGLSNVSIDGTSLADIQLLGIDAPNLTSGPAASVPVDAYVRQNDLVATYGETDGQRRRLQAYWRVIELESNCTAIAVFELVVSVQTELLDSHPAMSVVSCYTRSECLRYGAIGSDKPEPLEFGEAHDRDGFLLVRPEGAAVSFMQAAHPADFAGYQASPSDDSQRQFKVRHPLFSEQLEKGVIRRARVRVAIVPRADDLSLTADCYRQFAASEPMLTA